MTWPTNDMRADWADSAVNAYRARTREDAEAADVQEILQHLLCDLWHWADRQETDFQSALEEAGEHYYEEVREEQGE